MDESPVQMTFLGVKELHIETFWPVTSETDYAPSEGVIQHAIGAFDAESRKIQIKLRFLSGVGHSPSAEEIKRMQDEKKQPFHLRAEVVGEFVVPTGSMPDSDVPEWAKRSAAPILMPFLREQVYALSLRVGTHPIILPLVLASPYVKIEQLGMDLDAQNRDKEVGVVPTPASRF